MGEPVEIVPATRADVPGVHRIEEESFPAPWRREFFAAELLADRRFCLVAKRNGVVIGYVFAMWLLDEMHINKIAVTAAERRQGIADDLMERCFAFAREHDVSSIALEVRKSNEGAQAFYRHLGFVAEHIRRNYYPDGEAAVVMVRRM